VSFDASGNRLLATFKSGHAVLTDVSGGQFSREVLNRKLLTEPILMGTLAPNGEVFSIRAASMRAYVYEVSKLESPIDVATAHAALSPSSGVFSSNGEYLFLSAHTRVECIDWKAPRKCRMQWAINGHSRANLRLRLVRDG